VRERRRRRSVATGSGTKPELHELLGIETSYELDGFLKAHDIWTEYTREDAEREIKSLQRLGF
jgi:hypothetical protein